MGEEGERLRDAGSASSFCCVIAIAVLRSTDSRRRATNPTGLGGTTGRWWSSPSAARDAEAARSRSCDDVSDWLESVECMRLLEELQSSISALELLRGCAVIRDASNCARLHKTSI